MKDQKENDLEWGWIFIAQFLKAWPLVFKEYIMTTELTEYSALISNCFESGVL